MSVTHARRTRLQSGGRAVSTWFLCALLASLASCGGEPTVVVVPPPPPPPPVPPIQVGSIPAQIVNVGESAVIDVAPYFSDPDGGPLGYAVATSSPAVVSTSMSGSSLTIVGVADGTATVVVTATDPDGLSATQTVGVTVPTPNHPPAPIGSIPAQSLTPGQTATLDAASYFSDPDGDALVYAATTSNAGVVSVGVSGSTLTLTGVADGRATVNVMATDPDGLSATQGFGVTVETPNRAPAPSGSIPAQSLTPGQTATLGVAPYFSDPDDDPLRYAATTSNAGVVSVRVSGSALTLTGVADGTATVTVTATDPDGLSATQNVDVTVETPNRAPARVGSIPAQNVDTGQSATLDVAQYFSDPDGDVLEYSATTSNANVVSAGVSGSTLTLTGVADGRATVTVTARDPDGLGARQRVGVTVQTPNHAPVPTGSIPAQNLDGGRAVTLDVAQYFSDPDGDALRYAAATSNAGVVSPRLFQSNLTLLARAGGEATVTVTATDPGGLTGTQTIEVSVRGRVGGFRDDFETSVSLDDWSIHGAEATITDSVLHLTNGSAGTGSAERLSAPSLRGWELSAEISRVTAEATPGVIWFTGHHRFHAVRILLPTSTTRNYEFAVFDVAQNAWIVIEDLSGRSRRIGATPNSYDQFRLGHETDGYFVFEVGEGDFGSTILRLSLDAPLYGVRLGDLLDRIVDIWLVNRGAMDATALFDWVEVSGEEVAATSSDADTPPGFDQVKAAAGAPAAPYRLSR